jgi:uncharacterized protein (TIGR03437 family)
MNNNAPSNSVTVYTSNTAPGVFANPVAVGVAAAQDGANYSLINSGSPASPNETIIIYMGGLGAVTPTITPDGAAAPISPLSYVNDPNVAVDFSYVDAPMPSFAGLTPTATGLYQIDVAVPAGTDSDVYVDVGTTDGYTSMATMSIASGFTGENKPKIIGKRLARNKTRAKKSTLKPQGR